VFLVDRCAAVTYCFCNGVGVCLLSGTDWFLWLALVWIFSKLTSRYRQNAVYNSPQRIYTMRCHFRVKEAYSIHYRTILI
jgi:hypothetical protein